MRDKKPRENDQRFDHRIFATRYFEGYELQTVNGKAKRVYVGDTYWPAKGVEAVHSAKPRYTVCLALFFALALLGGFQRSPVNASPWVVLFYAGSLCAGVFALVGAVRFCATRSAMTKYSYQRYEKETGYGAPASAFFMAVATAVSLVLMLGDLKAAGSYVLPLLCFLLSAALMYAIWRIYSGLPFEKTVGREPCEEIVEE